MTHVMRICVFLVALAGLVLGVGVGIRFRRPPLPVEPRFLPVDLPELKLWARPDQVDSRSAELEILDTEAVIWLESPRQLGPVLFRVFGRLGKVEVRSGAVAKEFEPPSGEAARRFFLEWLPDKARRDPARPGYFYRLVLSFPERPKGNAGEEDTVRLALVGTRAYLDRDFYSAEWLGCGVPDEVSTGEEIQVLAHVRNTSRHTWPHHGPARVRLTSRWLATGKEAGPRRDLEAPVEPGEELSRWLRVRAPSEPGRYSLQLDLFFEPMASFAERGAATCHAEIAVR